ncbi:dienelactone hydrolase family protein [candidate division FCPU426 bacterium]|nr:dienelactone hydrolase family protein [candidate division FCPU426 bacterium]
MTVLAAVLLAHNTATAKRMDKTVDYEQDGKIFHSYLVYNDDLAGKRPGVLVFPEWWGLNDYAKMRAAQLADLGYAALAVDIYGQGRQTQDRKQAGEWSGGLKKSGSLPAHALAAWEALKKQEVVDPAHTAAIGYCFGGTAVLALAYTGADVRGVVSFHGGLQVPDVQQAPHIKAQILILHGASDPHVSAETIQQLQSVLEKAGTDWQMVYYSGAVHAFTNPKAGNQPETGAAYQERAARRSWEHMRLFLHELFPAFFNKGRSAVR